MSVLGIVVVIIIVVIIIVVIIIIVIIKLTIGPSITKRSIPII